MQTLAHTMTTALVAPATSVARQGGNARVNRAPAPVAKAAALSMRAANNGVLSMTSAASRPSVVAQASRSSSFAVVAAFEATVADTKKNFLESYPYPIPSIWSVAVNELLVQQHFIKYNAKYSYNKLATLGFVSVFDQLLEGFPSDESKEEIFKCFLEALGEDPVQWRADATELSEFASSASGVDALVACDVFATMKAQNEASNFLYNKFIAIGMFRLLELAKATEPAALEKLAGDAGIPLSKINSDLGVYKGLLSKLAAAKELQAEIFAREKRKNEERLAKKAAAASTTTVTETPTAEA